MTVVIVDLSNVCRDTRLGAPPSLAAFDRLRHAWTEQIDAAATFVLVADESLGRHLEQESRKRLASFRGEEWFLDAPRADDVILDLVAQDATSRVLSCDRFVGHRRTRPEAFEDRKRFHAWEIVDGELRIRHHERFAVGAFEISRAEQNDRMLADGVRGAPGVRDAALLKRFRCASTDPNCVARALDPDMLHTWPRRVRNKGLVCPGCLGRVEEVGERPLAIELKILVDGEMIDRFLLADGDAVTVGRASLDPASPLGQLVATGRLTGLSREHAVLQVRGTNLYVRDVGSSGGITRQRWNHVQRWHEAPERLSQGLERKVGVRDRLILAGALTIERSGKPLAEADNLRVGVPSSPLANDPTTTD
ncbi:MAG: FHA domain-containing protein [Solirubrobacteraceae bacterium]